VFLPVNLFLMPPLPVFFPFVKIFRGPLLFLLSRYRGFFHRLLVVSFFFNQKPLGPTLPGRCPVFSSTGPPSPMSQSISSFCGLCFASPPHFRILFVHLREGPAVPTAVSPSPRRMVSLRFLPFVASQLFFTRLTVPLLAALPHVPFYVVKVFFLEAPLGVSSPFVFWTLPLVRYPPVPLYRIAVIFFKFSLLSSFVVFFSSLFGHFLGFLFWPGESHLSPFSTQCGLDPEISPLLVTWIDNFFQVNFPCRPQFFFFRGRSLLYSSLAQFETFFPYLSFLSTPAWAVRGCLFFSNPH